MEELGENGKKKRNNSVPRNVIILGLVSMFIDMSTDMVNSITPMFLVVISTAPVIIGLIEGITEGLATLLKTFAGYLSDKTNKKKALTIGGYSAALFYKIGLIISTTWVGVFVSKIIDRTGKGLRTAPRDSIIAESTKDRLGKNYGIHKMFDMLGSSIGILLAYIIFVNNASYREVFYWSIVPAVCGVVLLFFVKEKKRTSLDNDEVLAINETPKKEMISKRVWFYLLAVFIFSIGNSSNAFLLLRAQDNGISIQNTLLLYLLFNVVSSILSIPFGKLSDKIGRKKNIVGAYLIYAFVYVGFAMFTQAYMMIVLFGIYGIYSAMLGGTEKALAVEISPKTLKGTVLGLQGAAQGIGLLISSLMAGVLWETAGTAMPFYFGAMMAIVAAVAMFFILNKPKSKEIRE